MTAPATSLAAPRPRLALCRAHIGDGTRRRSALAAVRPKACLPYEHMFSTRRTSTLAQRALGALDLARSFLLLEDDYEVDWEVDADEPAQVPHPHRVPLRGRARERRAGAPAPRPHLCLSPVENVRAPRRRDVGRSPRSGVGEREQEPERSER